MKSILTNVSASFSNCNDHGELKLSHPSRNVNEPMKFPEPNSTSGWQISLLKNHATPTPQFGGRCLAIAPISNDTDIRRCEVRCDVLWQHKSTSAGVCWISDNLFSSRNKTPSSWQLVAAASFQELFSGVQPSPQLMNCWKLEIKMSITRRSDIISWDHNLPSNQLAKKWLQHKCVLQWQGSL